MNREQHRRVLVVDDDAETRKLLLAVLEQRDLIVDEAVNGREAIALLQENRYAVVLLDLILPEVDGFEVLKAVRREEYPPVVLVVSGAERPVLDRLDARSIHGIVKKPFDPNEIADVVAACAEIRGRSTLETMAYATIMSGAPLIALLKL